MVNTKLLLREKVAFALLLFYGSRGRTKLFLGVVLLLFIFCPTWWKKRSLVVSRRWLNFWEKKTIWERLAYRRIFTSFLTVDRTMTGPLFVHGTGWGDSVCSLTKKQKTENNNNKIQNPKTIWRKKYKKNAKNNTKRGIVIVALTSCSILLVYYNSCSLIVIICISLLFPCHQRATSLLWTISTMTTIATTKEQQQTSETTIMKRQLRQER